LLNLSNYNYFLTGNW